MIFRRLVQNHLKDPFATVTSGGILYRRSKDKVEILVGFRHGKQWDRYLEIESAGYVDPGTRRRGGDTTIISTAIRECWEETGGHNKHSVGLWMRPTFVVGVYGPARYHSEAYLDPKSKLGFSVRSVLTPNGPKQAQIIPVVHHVFAGVARSGSLADTSEKTGCCWREVMDIVKNDGHRLAFDSAKALYEFVSIIRNRQLRQERKHALSMFF